MASATVLVSRGARRTHAENTGPVVSWSFAQSHDGLNQLSVMVQPHPGPYSSPTSVLFSGFFIFGYLFVAFLLVLGPSGPKPPDPLEI